VALDQHTLFEQGLVFDMCRDRMHPQLVDLFKAPGEALNAVPVIPERTLIHAEIVCRLMVAKVMDSALHFQAFRWLPTAVQAVCPPPSGIILPVNSSTITTCGPGSHIRGSRWYRKRARSAPGSQVTEQVPLLRAGISSGGFVASNQRYSSKSRNRASSPGRPAG